MVVSLNKIQTKQFAEFLSSMAVAWLKSTYFNFDLPIFWIWYYQFVFIDAYTKED